MSVRTGRLRGERPQGEHAALYAELFSDAAVAATPSVEVLYAVHHDAWGRGYATDMAIAAVDHDDLGMLRQLGVLPLA